MGSPEEKVTQLLSIYDHLRAIDVGEYTKEKNKFTYLPWAKAWDLLLSKFPQSDWDVIMFDGVPYLKTEVGYFVKTKVTISGDTRTEMMPVISYSNKIIESPNAFQINTSIRRCLAKNLAKFGLGINLYVGEEFVAEGGEYTVQQKQEFDEYFNAQDGFSLVCLKNDLGLEAYFSLYNSFPKGRKGEMKEACAEIEAGGVPIFKDVLDTLDEHIKEGNELGCMEVWEELSKRQKSAIYKELSEHDQATLKKLLGKESEHGSEN